MAFAPIYSSPSLGNVFIPNHEASGRMVVEFSANDDWPVNRYAQKIKVNKMAGVYQFINPDTQMRSKAAKAGNEFVWNDGADRPSPHDNNAEFTNQGFFCERFAPSASIGWLTRDQAEYDWLAHYGRQLSHQNMLIRARRAISLLDDTTVYPADHLFNFATAGGGGFAGGSTTTTNLIKIAFQYAARLILLKTGARIGINDIVAIMSPATAIGLAAAPEIATVLIQSPFAQSYISGDDDNNNAVYGLPKRLFGLEIVVEDTPYVSTKKGAPTTTRQFIMPDNEIFFVAKPGTRTGPSDFAALTFFVYQDMQIQTLDDPKNERVDVSCVDIWDVKLVAPIAAARMVNVLS